MTEVLTLKDLYVQEQHEQGWPPEPLADALRREHDKRKAWEDVLWALINTREFLFRH